MKFISVDVFSNVVNGCNILYFQENIDNVYTYIYIYIYMFTEN